jgi:hypothetical protein
MPAYLLGDRQMADMDWVEGAAQNSDMFGHGRIIAEVFYCQEVLQCLVPE